MKITGTTNVELKKTIIGLKKLKKYPELVKELEKPRRKKFAVNLKDIESCGSNKIVALDVLGTGELTKPYTVYSWRYSKSAKDKIEKAGGKALNLNDLIRNKDEVTFVRC